MTSSSSKFVYNVKQKSGQRLWLKNEMKACGHRWCFKTNLSKTYKTFLWWKRNIDLENNWNWSSQRNRKRDKEERISSYRRSGTFTSRKTKTIEFFLKIAQFKGIIYPRMIISLLFSGSIANYSTAPWLFLLISGEKVEVEQTLTRENARLKECRNDKMIFSLSYSVAITISVIITNLDWVLAKFTLNYSQNSFFIWCFWRYKKPFNDNYISTKKLRCLRWLCPQWNVE